MDVSHLCGHQHCIGLATDYTFCRRHDIVMGKGSDGILNGLIRFTHETLGFSPNQISTIGWIVGMVAAGLVAAGFLLQGLIVLAVSQIIDGLDGGVARRYGLQSEK